MMTSYKPQRLSFIAVYVFFGGVIGAVVAAVASFYVSLPLSAGAGVTVLIGSYVRRRRQYQKEEYRLTDEGLTVTRGSRFSSHEVTVPWERVTATKYVRPFFQRMLFSTGTCRVDSAGSSKSSVVLRHVPPDGVVNAVSSQLVSDTAVDTEVRPSLVAAIGQSFWQAITSIVGIIFLFTVPSQQSLGSLPLTAIVILLVSLVANGLSAARRIIDDVSLTYQARSDRVTVHGGVFRLEHHELFARHVTDTATDQTVLERLLDVENINISVAGGKQEVVLPYVPSEAGFETAIPRSDQTSAEELAARDEDEYHDTSDETVSASPNLARSVVGAVTSLAVAIPVFIVFPPAIVFGAFYLGQRLLLPLATTYDASSTSITSTFSFFDRRTTSFDKDRVTGVVLRRNPVDFVFGTVTVAVQTVGSSQRLRLQHLPRDHRLVEEVVSVKAFEEEQHRVVPHVTPYNLFTRYAPFMLFTLVLAGALLGTGRPLVGIAILGGVGSWLGWQAWRLWFAKLRFGESKLQLRRGILFTESVTTSYDDVKRLRSTLYPLNTAGSLTFFIPGGASHLGGNGFSLPSVENPWQQHGVVDGCLQRASWSSPLNPRGVEWEDEPRLLPVVLRAGLAALIVGVVLTGLSVFDVMSSVAVGGSSVFLVGLLGAYVLYYDQIRYSETSERFVAETGIMYRSSETVLKDRLDYDDVSRYWYHLLTETGTVSLYTTGSEEKDLVFEDVSSWRSLRDNLK